MPLPRVMSLRLAILSTGFVQAGLAVWLRPAWDLELEAVMMPFPETVFALRILD